MDSLERATQAFEGGVYDLSRKSVSSACKQPDDEDFREKSIKNSSCIVTLPLGQDRRGAQPCHGFFFGLGDISHSLFHTDNKVS